MKNLIATTLFLFLAGMEAKAQEYVPMLENDPEWIMYMEKPYDYQPDHKMLQRFFLSGKEFNIDGRIYKQMKVETMDSTKKPNVSGQGLICEKDRKVYYRGKDYQLGKIDSALLYDFTCEKGDTVHHMKGYGFYSVIKNIDSVKIDGKYRKRYKVETHNHSPDDYWIEGIGGTYNGLLGHVTGHLVSYDMGWEFICHKKNGKPIYLNPSYDTCYPVGLITSMQSNPDPYSGISLYPNPFNQELHIGNLPKQHVQLEVADMLGRIICQKELVHAHHTIQIPGHHGFLIITLKDSQGRVIKREKMIRH